MTNWQWHFKTYAEAQRSDAALKNVGFKFNLELKINKYILGF